MLTREDMGISVILTFCTIIIFKSATFTFVPSARLALPPHLRDFLLPEMSPNSKLSLVFLSLLVFFFFHYSQYTLTDSKYLNTPTQLFLSLSSNANLSLYSHLKTLTSHPHLAGTDQSLSTTNYVLSHFETCGFETLVKNYKPLLSYPSFSSLSMKYENRTLTKILSLLEPEDKKGIFVPPYHAYSPSGSVIATSVYVNYGNERDYFELEKLGLDVKGKVVILRRGDGPRGAVVEKAAEKGAKAVLMFGEKADGGVERGTVLLNGLGDPLTPGWGATDEAEKLGIEDDIVKRRFPKIPSMPISLSTAMEILRTMTGPRVPKQWMSEVVHEWGGVGGGASMVLNFTYQEDRRLVTIQNVFGIISGRLEPDRYIILGNHRDAWTYGAVDPNSGTAALLDIARRFGVMLQSGWRPRRTIILCSWDAEEFGMIGSTEWVEENLGILAQNAVTYLNIDCAVQGSGFFAGASPQLDDILIEITKLVTDPDNKGKSVYETWVAANGGISIDRLVRADSDFSSFLHHAGIPSLDMYYGEVFSGYHTAFDSFEWMEKIGDPSFDHHVAMSELWGLLALRLADDRILPFSYVSYATLLQNHTNALKAYINSEKLLQPLIASVAEFADAATMSESKARKLKQELNSKGNSELRIRNFNDRLMLVERSFLAAEGLKGRDWFKHLLYSPSKDYENKLQFFPGISDAIAEGNKLGKEEANLHIQQEIWRVARAILKASAVLQGEFI